MTHFGPMLEITSQAFLHGTQTDRQTDIYININTHTSTSTKGTDIQNVEALPDKFNALESVFKKLVLPKNEIK